MIDQLYLKWCGNDLSNLAYSFQIWIGCQSEVQLKYVIMLQGLEREIEWDIIL